MKAYLNDRSECPRRNGLCFSSMRASSKAMRCNLSITDKFPGRGYSGPGKIVTIAEQDALLLAPDSRLDERVMPGNGE